MGFFIACPCTDEEMANSCRTQINYQRLRVEARCPWARCRFDSAWCCNELTRLYGMCESENFEVTLSAAAHWTIIWSQCVEPHAATIPLTKHNEKRNYVIMLCSQPIYRKPVILCVNVSMQIFLLGDSESMNDTPPSFHNFDSWFNHHCPKSLPRHLDWLLTSWVAAAFHSHVVTL